MNQTLFIDGKQLTTAHDRAHEADIQASMIPFNSPEAWCFGVGIGDLPRACLRTNPGKLHVVIVNRGVFDMARAMFDQSDWMNDSRVVIHEPQEVDRPVAPFAISPLEVEYSDPSAWHLRDRIAISMNEAFNLERMRVLAGRLFDANGAENAKLNDGSVTELFGTDGRDAVVCGGGPTLAQFYDWIKASNRLIVAASTCLLPLERAGIYPDVTVCIDEAPQQVKHFEEAENKGVLVYRQSVDPKIPRLWNGRRLVVGDHDLFRGGSVIHGQLDLAVRMGAKTVYLLGADFGYPARKHHVDGAPLTDHAPESLATLNGHGQIIRTDPNLAQYRVYVEDYVRLHPEVKFWKLGRDGAETRGMEWLDA